MPDYGKKTYNCLAGCVEKYKSELRDIADRESDKEELRKTYGYPPEGYICPICLKNEGDLKGTGGNASVWVVDHNHETNTFRGHICHNCNRGLGVFQDSIDRLNRAIDYLSKDML